MVKETTTMKPNASNDKGLGALFSAEKLSTFQRLTVLL